VGKGGKVTDKTTEETERRVSGREAREEGPHSIHLRTLQGKRKMSRMNANQAKRNGLSSGFWQCVRNKSKNPIARLSNRCTTAIISAENCEANQSEVFGKATSKTKNACPKRDGFKCMNLKHDRMCKLATTLPTVRRLSWSYG
jgi:hypothetical protein